MNLRQIFQRHLAQTSPLPMGLHITRAKGNYLFDSDNKAYLDLIGGIGVCNMGHVPSPVVDAINKQTERFLHVMVYGELIQSPQVEFAQTLCNHLPEALNCVYFTNSGAEAVEGAIKLARRYTRRPHIIACHNSYHGHTTGALSLMGDEYWRQAFRPLIPGVRHYRYNDRELLHAIDEETAAVVIEPVQAEAGVIVPDQHWVQDLRQKCQELGALLILDEIQTALGRTGTLWAFQRFGIVPDILLLAKALGGGMPLGAFISSREIMGSLTSNPVLGHMTTFGGHPVCCAAGKAAFELLLQQEDILDTVVEKEKLFLSLLRHNKIKAVRSAGLLIAIELEAPEVVSKCLEFCLHNGIFSDWFLFAPACIRIAPPLTITEEEIRYVCSILLEYLDQHK